MPQMGESIAEGTIVRWIKKVGESVDRDEPLFEITTDKVDAEIPAPAAGVLTEIKVKEGETVAVNTVVGTIGQPGEETAAQSDGKDGASTVAGSEAAATSTQAQGDGQPSATATSTSEKAAQGSSPSLPPPTQASPKSSPPGPSDIHRRKSSPLVRRIARDNNLDIDEAAVLPSTTSLLIWKRTRRHHARRKSRKRVRPRALQRIASKYNRSRPCGRRSPSAWY
jgi:pyruvate dehydrogenase E2 component (dihydrolipoamide acetyltransferase)